MNNPLLQDNHMQAVFFTMSATHAACRHTLLEAKAVSTFTWRQDLFHRLKLQTAQQVLKMLGETYWKTLKTLMPGYTLLGHSTSSQHAFVTDFVVT